MRDESRYYCFTDFEKDLNDYNNKKIRYVFIGEEVCPTTGKLHWQGWFYTENPMSESAARKMLPRRHLEIMKGTPEENTKYCSKEGNIIYENGKPPYKGPRRDLIAIQNGIDDGATELEIAQSNFGLWCQYGKRFEAYRQLVEPKRNWVTEVIYTWGGTGSGKTRTANDDGAKKIYYNARTGFWRGYNGESIIRIDELKPNWIDRELFLDLCDRYEFELEIKNGSRNFIAKKIYLTSNYSPEYVFDNDPAMMRRITQIINLN